LFIDFLALMLLNMTAGFVVLAAFLLMGLTSGDGKRWAASFAIVGLIAIVTGFRMTFTWPLPGSYNSAFGEMSVLLGIVFLGAGVAMAKVWSLKGVTLYAFFAGWAAIVLGVRIFQLHLTLVPVLASASFILSGLAGVLAAPALAMKGNKPFRALAAAVLVVTGLVWAATAYPEYAIHIKIFKTWVPVLMRGPAGH